MLGTLSDIRRLSEAAVDSVKGKNPMVLWKGEGNSGNAVYRLKDTRL
jgi:hypothetical protein